VSGSAVALLVPYIFGLRQVALLLAAILLLAPCAVGIGFVLGAVLWVLFPRLERDYGVQEGEFLHITPRREPSKRG
jgi:hypothetical protein